MDTNAFYKYVEGRAISGYGSAILVKEQNADKYSLLIASETVPSVFGTPDSFEFDLLNSPSKGKVVGKESLDDKEVEFLLHRDNVVRLEGLKGKALDFMYVTPDFMGWKFTGTISYRANDATADVLRGTYVITPMSADKDPILDVRDMCLPQLTITDVVADKLDVTTGNDTVNIVCDQNDFTIKCEVKDNDGKAVVGITGTPTQPSSNNKGSVKFAGSTTASGIAYITVSKDSFASWTTTVLVSTTGK